MPRQIPHILIRIGGFVPSDARWLEITDSGDGMVRQSARAELLATRIEVNRIAEDEGEQKSCKQA